jgi:hypothetical protein
MANKPRVKTPHDLGLLVDVCCPRCWGKGYLEQRAIGRDEWLQFPCDNRCNNGRLTMVPIDCAKRYAELHDSITEFERGF